MKDTKCKTAVTLFVSAPAKKAGGVAGASASGVAPDVSGDSCLPNETLPELALSMDVPLGGAVQAVQAAQAARTGRQGEQAAAAYLLEAGFELCACNWRAGRYELDIVARRGCELHFVEVKTRRAEGLTTPEQAMTPAKCRAFLRAAEHYLERVGAGCEPHFDLAAVDVAPDGSFRVRFVPDAVELHW